MEFGVAVGVVTGASVAATVAVESDPLEHAANAISATTENALIHLVNSLVCNIGSGKYWESTQSNDTDQYRHAGG